MTQLQENSLLSGDEVIRDLPMVSVIIPARNEEKFIETGIRAVLANNYPINRLEVLVVDGMSEDRTPDIVAQLSQEDPRVRLVRNPRRITPAAFNEGVRNARGDIVCIVGGHSTVSPDFVRLSVADLLDHPDVWAMGGACVPQYSSFVSQTIGEASCSPFGTGGARYHCRDHVCYVTDAIAGPVFWKWVFNKVGYFDEEMIRNQDVDMTDRIIAAGGKLLHDGRRIHYYSSRSSFQKLWRQYWQYGFWRIRNMQKSGRITTARQIVPMLFVGGWVVLILATLLWRPAKHLLMAAGAAYLLLLLIGAAKIGRSAGFRHSLLAPLAFVILHFSYGLGCLHGIWTFCIRRRGDKPIEDQKSSR
ncbi:MAG: glycosyltransferase family 2 protein [Planctomycetes bacterium]|nr:glycosyltransferase family 2 protein [Planctomycetota bacterium]